MQARKKHKNCLCKAVGIYSVPLARSLISLLVNPYTGKNYSGQSSLQLYIVRKNKLIVTNEDTLSAHHSVFTYKAQQNAVCDGHSHFNWAVFRADCRVTKNTGSLYTALD